MSERREVLAHFEEQREATEGRIAEGIEAHRKGDARITVTKKDGTPLAGARGCTGPGGAKKPSLPLWGKPFHAGGA